MNLRIVHAGICLFAISAAATATGTPAPVGRWDLNEGRDQHIHDTSGHDNHGLAQDAAWLEVEKGYALEFDGQEARVNCGPGASLDLTEAVTLEAWVYPSAPANSETGIAGKSFTSYGMTYYTDGRLYWYIGNGANKCSAPVKEKTWFHAAGAFDGATMKLYINGVLADTTKSQFDRIPRGGDFLIGCIGKGAYTDSFKGAIGTVRVYDEALPEEAIYAHYEAEAENYPKPPTKYAGMVLRPFLYLDEGKIIVDVDASYLYSRAANADMALEIREPGAKTPLQRHALPTMPKSGVLRDAAVELAPLEAGTYELRVTLSQGGACVDAVVLPFTHPAEMSLPSPAERTAPPLASPPGPVDYRLEVDPRGGFVVAVGNERYPVESTYSYPGGGYNALPVGEREDTKAESAWAVKVEQHGAAAVLVTARGAHYSIERIIKQEAHRVLVKDTIRNTSGAELGILLSNHLTTGNVPDLESTSLPNPSVFLHKEGLGLGIVALDDVYLEQYRTFTKKERSGIRSDMFGLDAGASYTLEWAVYVNGTGAYYDFINQVRKDEGYLPSIEGGFAFTDRRESPTKDYVEARNLRYASIGCLGHVPDDPGLSLEGIEFAQYPKECALLEATFAETRRRYPSMKVMFHIAHSLYTTNKPAELFPDSRVINADGVQTDYGGQNTAYYVKYFSKERVDEGYRWYIFYPAMDNSFGKAMLEATDYMLDELGVNGMFADGFTHGYGGRFTYDRWDGHTVEIDPETKRITRKLASVNLLAQDVLIEVARRIKKKGGVVIANSYPGTRTVHREGILYCLETAGGGRVCARLHLAPSVIALGNPGSLNTERDVYDDIRDKLMWGGVYFYYGEKQVSPGTIISQMYPITIEEIGEGIIKGKERIITLQSGVYGWPGDNALHTVYRYDGRGIPAAHAFLTTVDGTGSARWRAVVRTEVTLGESEAAVVKKIPVHLSADTPVNLLVQQYDVDGIRMLLSGTGEAALEMADGDFPIRSSTRYVVSIDGQEGRLAGEDGSLTVVFPLGAQTVVTVRRET